MCTKTQRAIDNNFRQLVETPFPIKGLYNLRDNIKKALPCQANICCSLNFTCKKALLAAVFPYLEIYSLHRHGLFRYVYLSDEIFYIIRYIANTAYTEIFYQYLSHIRRQERRQRWSKMDIFYP